MDCIEYMRSLPDNAFDIAVCDPPYGKGNDDNLVGGGSDRDSKSTSDLQGGGGQEIKTCPHRDASGEGSGATTSRWNRLLGGRRERYYKPADTQVQWRDVGGEIQNWGAKAETPQWDVAPPQEFFDELFRISRNQIIWGGNYFSLPPTRCFLVWRKTSISERFSMAMAEYAWTSFTGNAKVFDSPPQRRENSGKFHPTEKPLELYGWIYRNYVKDGETVFDPMMGSQASRIAAYKMGIDYVGCEIDKYYYDKGCEWFERECHGITKTASGKTIIEQTLFEL